MSSLRRIRASRVNGTRSLGPVTAEGKRRSSQNALRHGLLADCIVLQGESRQGFQDLLQEHVERFDPSDAVEFGMIEEMASAQWRLRRLWAIETDTFDESLAAEPEGTSLRRIAAAFRKLASGPALTLIHRYETRLHMMYQRAFQNLLVLRATNIPNEPNPISGHLDTPAISLEIAPAPSSAAETPENPCLDNHSPIRGE